MGRIVILRVNVSFGISKRIQPQSILRMKEESKIIIYRKLEKGKMSKDYLKEKKKLCYLVIIAITST